MLDKAHITCCTTGSPNPLTQGLVVLNNSKMFSATRNSNAVITDFQDHDGLDRLRQPPSRVASTAFLQRFKTACFIFAESILIGEWAVLKVGFNLIPAAR